MPFLIELGKQDIAVDAVVFVYTFMACFVHGIVIYFPAQLN